MNEPILDVFVEGEPVPQGSKRAWYNAKTKHVHMAEEMGVRHRTWRAEVTSTVKLEHNGADIETGPLSVALTFYQVRGVGHYGSGRNTQQLKPSAPSYPIKPPDIDKLTRSILDSLTHVVWVDDAQVVAITMRKRWCDRFTGTPGVRIVVGRVVDALA